jgi:hypothetical protein
LRKAAEPDLERVALRLAEVLGETAVLVGAMAVGAHGYVRATGDVDFVAELPLAEVSKRLRDHGISATLHRGDPLEGDFPCLKGTLDGVRFDVMPPLVPLDLKRAIEVSMSASGRLRVVDLDGLIRLKLRAQGPKDLMDVAALVLRHPDQLETTRKAAGAYGILDRLDHWLRDPRLQAEILEMRRAEQSRKRGNTNPARRRKRH